MKVQSGDVQLHVEDHGGSGEPLVLVMGIGAQLVLWPDEFCEVLQSRGFRVIRFDHRDIGMSTHLKHLPIPDPKKTLAKALFGLPIDAPYTLSDMANDIRAILDHLGVDRAHIMGMSMGGMVAQTFCLEHPDRALSLTSMSSTTGCRRYALRADPKAFGALLARPPRTREECAERIATMFRAIGSKTYEPDEALLRKMGEDAFDRGPNPAGFARHLAAICASGSRRKKLPSLRLPTLVIHGTQDPLIPPAAGRGTAELIPNARLLELGDMGHDLPKPLWPVFADAVKSIASSSALNK